MESPTFKAAYQRGVTAAGTDYNIVNALAISCLYL